MRSARKYTPDIHLNLNVRGLPQSATPAINERCARLQREGKQVFKLGLGQSPFPVPQPVVDELRVNAHQKDYLPVRGLRNCARRSPTTTAARRDSSEPKRTCSSVPAPRN